MGDMVIHLIWAAVGYMFGVITVLAVSVTMFSSDMSEQERRNGRGE